MRAVVRNLEQHYTPGNGGKTQQGDDRPLHLDVRRKPRASHCGDELNRTKGDVEEDSLELVEAEGLNNQRAERRDATAGNTAVVSLVVARGLWRHTRWKTSRQTKRMT